MINSRNDLCGVILFEYYREMNLKMFFRKLFCRFLRISQFAFIPLIITAKKIASNILIHILRNMQSYIFIMEMKINLESCISVETFLIKNSSSQSERKFQFSVTRKSFKVLFESAFRVL